MSGLIHFVSGKTLEVDEYEFKNMPVQLNGKGIRTKTLRSGHLVPLNSTTIEFIEYVPEPVKVHSLSELNPVGVKGDEMIDGLKEAEMNFQKEAPKKKTAEERLAEITAKSECQHEPTKLRLYVQHTAKGIRYFPVCGYCGKRERYVSESKIMKNEYVGTVNEKWNENDIAEATPWVDK